MIAATAKIHPSSIIEDGAAISFASAFYRAIAYGGSVAAAFTQGIAALKLLGTGESDIPQLIARHGVDPASVILFEPPKPVDFAGLRFAFAAPIRNFFRSRTTNLRTLLQGSLLLRVVTDAYNEGRKDIRTSSDQTLIGLVDKFIRELNRESATLDSLSKVLNESVARWSHFFNSSCASKMNKLVEVASAPSDTTKSLLDLCGSMAKEMKRELRKVRREKRREVCMKYISMMAQASEPLFTVQIAYSILTGNAYNELLVALPEEAVEGGDLEPVIWEFCMSDDGPVAGTVEVPKQLLSHSSAAGVQSD